MYLVWNFTFCPSVMSVKCKILSWKRATFHLFSQNYLKGVYYLYIIKSRHQLKRKETGLCITMEMNH
jgi:hypothetical protein